jgi:hypothetical protein
MIRYLKSQNPYRSVPVHGESMRCSQLERLDTQELLEARTNCFDLSSPASVSAAPPAEPIKRAAAAAK